MARLALPKGLLALTGASTSWARAGCRAVPSHHCFEAGKVSIDSEVRLIEIEWALLSRTAHMGASDLHAGLSEVPVADLVVDLGLILQL